MGEHDLDACECGDWRRDHIDGTGACKFNKNAANVGHGGPADCMEFRLSVPASRAWKLEELLVEAREHVCIQTCQPVWNTAEGQKHSDLCTRISAELADPLNPSGNGDN